MAKEYLKVGKIDTKKALDSPNIKKAIPEILGTVGGAKSEAFKAYEKDVLNAVSPELNALENQLTLALNKMLPHDKLMKTKETYDLFKQRKQLDTDIRQLETQRQKLRYSNNDDDAQAMLFEVEVSLAETRDRYNTVNDLFMKRYLEEFRGEKLPKEIAELNRDLLRARAAYHEQIGAEMEELKAKIEVLRSIYVLVTEMNYKTVEILDAKTQGIFGVSAGSKIISGSNKDIPMIKILTEI